MRENSNDQPAGEKPMVTAQNVAAYIADVTSSLVDLASARDLRTLRYLLDMARTEAVVLARKTRN